MNAAATHVAGVETELALRSVELVYERRPELAAAYGPAGRARCLEDARFHVRFLLAALAIDDDEVFRDYAAWCGELLARLAIPPDHLASSLDALGDAVEAFAPAAAGRARQALQAGRDALGT